mgnify:CR=1 FL=1|tara:strand:- start:587 stop:802 length:216 start_codon:yes stop_codon:yes gene_type:complete
MTPKEKAQDLIEKFTDENHHFEKDTIEWAIHFSVICCDEIIEHSPDENEPNLVWSDTQVFYRTVKDELSLL